jgi:hypothetical protein
MNLWHYVEIENVEINSIDLITIVFDFDRFSYFWKTLKNQNRQSQNRDDDAKSIEMQRQRFFKKQNQREKRVKNSKEFVQLI